MALSTAACDRQRCRAPPQRGRFPLIFLLRAGPSNRPYIRHRRFRFVR